MYRLFTALFCLALFACNPGATSTGDADAAVTTPDTEAQPAVPAPTAGDESMMKGDNYEVTVIDGTIKSPRKELTGTVAGTEVKVNYGSPAVNERTIYGDLVPFGKVWRTGANEATRITFSGPVMVGAEGKALEAGTYSLFTIPNAKDDWTIVFNTVGDQWGAYDYEEGKDAARIQGTARMLDSPAERMDFMLDGDDVVLMWADVAVAFPVKAQGK